MRKKDIYVSRRESISLTFKCVFHRPELNAKSLACKCVSRSSDAEMVYTNG